MMMKKQKRKGSVKLMSVQAVSVTKKAVLIFIHRTLHLGTARAVGAITALATHVFNKNRRLKNE